MSTLNVVKTLTMGKGITLKIMVDENEPDDSAEKWFVEGICDGEPNSAAFYVPLHWHQKQGERFEVLEGRVELSINGKKRVISAGDPEVTIQPYDIHGLQGFKGERLVIRERADTAGNYKALFFNDLFSTPSPPGFWHSMRAFYDGDGIPYLGLYFRFFDVAFVTVFGGIAHLFDAAKPKEIV